MRLRAVYINFTKVIPSVQKFIHFSNLSQKTEVVFVSDTRKDV